VKRFDSTASKIQASARGPARAALKRLHWEIALELAHAKAVTGAAIGDIGAVIGETIHEEIRMHSAVKL
jgi:hypothetical protein